MLVATVRISLVPNDHLRPLRPWVIMHVKCKKSTYWGRTCNNEHNNEHEINKLYNSVRPDCLYGTPLDTEDKGPVKAWAFPITFEEVSYVLKLMTDNDFKRSV